MARFVAAEDLGDVAEALDFIDDGGFEETVGEEVFARAVDVVFDGEKANGVGTFPFDGAGEAAFGNEEGAEAVPVALAWRAGDDVVDRKHDVVDGIDVGGLGDGNAGSKVGRGLLLRQGEARGAEQHREKSGAENFHGHLVGLSWEARCRKEVMK